MLLNACSLFTFALLLAFHRGGEGGGVTVTSLAPADLDCLFDKQWKTQAVGCVFALAQDVSVSGPISVISTLTVVFI